MGDVGVGSAQQSRVAQAMKAVCDERGGCAFGLLLGDNIYSAGVTSAIDPQWRVKFEEPYAGIDFPFFATLGNHDYGAPALADTVGSLGIDPRRAQAQIDYASASSKFKMPAKHYRKAKGFVELISLNTTALFWQDLSLVADLVGFNDEAEALQADLLRWESDPLSTWRIAFGHHPYLSNGPHGIAGSYDGVFVNGLIGSGAVLKNFFENYVVGTYDVYIAGHDHSMQDFGDVAGTQILVSGAGAKFTGFEGSEPSVWQHSGAGFTLFEATKDELTIIFVTVSEPKSDDELWRYAHSRSVSRL